MFYTLHVVEPLRFYDSVLIKEMNEKWRSCATTDPMRSTRLAFCSNKQWIHL